LAALTCRSLLEQVGKVLLQVVDSYLLLYDPEPAVNVYVEVLAFQVRGIVPP
jgi:hypothetical protein